MTCDLERSRSRPTMKWTPKQPIGCRRRGQGSYERRTGRRARSASATEVQNRCGFAMGCKQVVLRADIGAKHRAAALIRPSRNPAGPPTRHHDRPVRREGFDCPALDTCSSLRRSPRREGSSSTPAASICSSIRWAPSYVSSSLPRCPNPPCRYRGIGQAIVELGTGIAARLQEQAPVSLGEV